MSGTAAAKSTIVLTSFLLLPALGFGAEANFERTLSVSAKPNVYVSTGSGYVHISPGSDGQVHIRGHVKAENNGWFQRGSAEDRVKDVAANPPIEQSGNEVRIGKRNSGDWLRNISIDYEITLPKDATVDAGSGSGDLRISDVTGGLKADTGSGSIEAHGIGGAVSLNTGSGEIGAELVNPTMTRAETGSGPIRLSGVQGPLKANTGSGDISIKGQPTSDWKLGTGSGSVELSTGSVGFSLDASTGSGSVQSDPPISTHGSLEKHHIRGDVNGGGPRVVIETGSGDIRIR